MVKRINLSQFQSQLRQLQQKQKQAINRYNQSIQRSKSQIRSAINEYNRRIRQYNAQVLQNRQKIQRELRHLQSANYQTVHIVSAKKLQQYYEIVQSVYPKDCYVTEGQEIILDLIDKEQATALAVARILEDDSATAEDIEVAEIGNKLQQISVDLNDRWQGAVFALNPANPDAARHFCTSAREIFTQILEIKAPDNMVFAYKPDCKKTDKGKATRREKILYLLRNLEVDESIAQYIDQDIENIIDLFSVFNGGTHGEAGKYGYQKLLQVRKRVEQGINFLCKLVIA